MGVSEFIYTYLFGGVTFLPLVLVLFLYLHPKQAQLVHVHSLKDEMKAGEFEEDRNTGLDSYKQGWLIVTQDYMESPDSISSTTQSVSESQESKSAYSSLYKLVQKDMSEFVKKPSRSASFDFNGYDFPSEPDLEEDDQALQSLQLLQLQSPGQFENSLNPPEKVRSSQKKHRFYAILKHGNLFLYKDESMKDVKHVIVLVNYFVSMWPRVLSDAQLFVKSSAIAIINSSKFADGLESKKIPRGSFFVYCDHNSAKEDWYFALIRATKQATSTIHESIDPKIYAKTLHFSTSNMMDLISTLYSTEGQIQTKWLNAIIGRLFLAFKDTKLLEDYLYMKVNKKLNKIKKPGFLDNFIIKSIYPGNLAPFLTFPKLKEISPDGTIIVSTYLTYKGGFALEIATKLSINFPTFKTREIDLLFRITLKAMEGPMLIKIKPPPSNRLWYTFEVEPVMDLKIEPIVSSRQMTYSIITNTIDKKFKEAIKESLVYPHWDDTVFYDTLDEIYRGGIWDPSVRAVPDEEDTEQDTPSSGQLLASEVVEEKEALILPRSRTRILKEFKKAKGKILEELEVKAGSDAREANSTQPPKASAINTLKKIGKWYFQEKLSDSSQTYTPPEMITNRRPRKLSASDEYMPVPGRTLKKKPSYEFGIHSANPAHSGSDVAVPKLNGSVPPHRQYPSTDSTSLSEEPTISTDDDEEYSLAYTQKSERSYSISSIPNANMGAEPSVTGVNANVSPDNMFLESHKLTQKAPPSPPKIHVTLPGRVKTDSILLSGLKGSSFAPQRHAQTSPSLSQTSGSQRSLQTSPTLVPSQASSRTHSRSVSPIRPKFESLYASATPKPKSPNLTPQRSNSVTLQARKAPDLPPR